MPDEVAPTGPAAHMVLVRIRHELYVAAARAQGIEIRSVADNQVVGVLDPALAFYALAAIPLDEATDQLLAGGPDGVVRRYDLESLREINRVELGGAIQAIAVAETENQNVIAVVQRFDIALLAADLSTFAVLRRDEATQAFKCCLYEAFDMWWLAVVYHDDAIAIWRLGDFDDISAEPAAVVPQAHSGQIWTIASTQLPSSDYAVATGSADGRIRLWTADVERGLVPAHTLQAGATVRALAVIPAHEPLLVSAAASGEVALWRISGRADRPVRIVTQHLGEAWGLAAATTDDGGVIVASGDMHGVTQIARMRLEVVSEQTAFVLYEGQGTLWAAAAGDTPDGPYLAVGGVDQTVRVLDPRNVREPSIVHGHVSTVRSMASVGTALDPHLITGGADRQVLDWDPANGRLNREVPMRHDGEVWAIVAFTLGARTYIATGSADGTVRICPLDGDEVHTVGRLGAVTALVATPAGDDVLLTANTPRGVYVISVVSATVVFQALDTAQSALCGVFDGSRHLVVAARPDDDVSTLIEVIEPHTRTVLAGYRHIVDARISALAAEQTDDTVMIAGGADDGTLLIWQLDGTPIARPVRLGRSTIRSVGFVRTSHYDGDPLAVYTADDNGRVAMFPIAAGDLVRSGGVVDPTLAPTAILIDDQPSLIDMLARDSLVEAVADVLLASDTEQPMVIGLHAPWGHGKSTVLRLLRARLDPSRAAATDRRTPKPSTHQLRALPGYEVGSLKQWWQGGAVRTRLSRAWAWRQAVRARAEGDALGFEMVPDDEHRTSAITVWFNPWMYQTAEQIWAGLAREILSEISDRLPRAQRERLWFDLNLRRTDPLALRKRIMASYLPRTLSGLAFAAGIAALVAVAVSAFAIATVQTVNMPAIVGTGGAILLAVLGFLANMGKNGYAKVSGWLAPATLMRPAPRGVGAPAADNAPEWRSAGDPMDTSERGYLYLIQHDIAEVMHLAGEHTTLVVFIDDLDRCGPRMVAETFEALNLFLNKAFGPAHCLIAFDSEMVAAQLGAYYGLTDRPGAVTVDDPLAHANWRFMEKMVDLPIRLPRIRDTAISSYLDGVMDRFGKPMQQPIRSSAVRTGVTSRPTGVRPPAGAEPAAEEIVSSVDERGGERLADYLESLPPVRQALRGALMALPGRSPRQAKAVINLWRFYMVLDYRGGYLSSRLSAMETHSLEMARFVELLVRWPWLLDVLSRSVRVSPGARRFVLTELLDTGDDDDRWAAAAAAAGLHVDDLDVIGLRDLLRRPGDANLFASIGARYL